MSRSAAVCVLAFLLTALSLSACGGSSEDETAAVPGGADPADVEVIDRWAEALTAGDIDAAAELFAIPSVAQNGPAFEISDRGDAKLFNASLPCGAILVAARPEGELTVATFELTERPGAGECGEGTGGEASTAFAIVDGEITEWRRVAADGGEIREPEPAPGSTV